MLSSMYVQSFKFNPLLKSIFEELLHNTRKMRQTTQAIIKCKNVQSSILIPLSWQILLSHLLSFADKGHEQISYQYAQKKTHIQVSNFCLDFVNYADQHISQMKSDSYGGMYANGSLAFLPLKNRLLFFRCV